MRLFKKVTFNYEDNRYEIRIYYNDNLINIASFRNNHPANGFRHQIQVPKRCDIQGILEDGLIDELIEISKKDLTEKRAERLFNLIRV